MPSYLPLVVFSLVLVAMVLAMARAPRLSLRIEGDELQLRQSVADGIFCLRRRLDLPVVLVVSVVAADRRAVPAKGMRLPGTWFPGVIRAGSYGLGDSRDFWNVRRADRVVVVQLVPGAAYRRVVLQVRDPDMTATRVAAQLRQRDDR